MILLLEDTHQGVRKLGINNHFIFCTIPWKRLFFYRKNTLVLLKNNILLWFTV